MMALPLLLACLIMVTFSPGLSKIPLLDSRP